MPKLLKYFICKANRSIYLGLAIGICILMIGVYQSISKPKDDVGLNGGGGGRLGPASLDLDTCGCPTTFGDPACEIRTSWTLDKSTSSGPFSNPDGEPYTFTVTVTEGPTTNVLTGEGQIVLSNSGDQDTFLSSIAVNLETIHTDPGPGNAPGPSGKNWDLLATAIQNEAGACDTAGWAATCYGELSATEGASLVLYDPDTNDVIALTGDLVIPPTLDNDCDGLRDEDPVYTGVNDTANSCDFIDNDGDGSYDEDPVDSIDNDNDTLFDEDDPNDDGDNCDDPLVADCVPTNGASCGGDGPRVDEDGACEDAVIINFKYEFDLEKLNGDVSIAPGDQMRIDLIATFKSGAMRGGTCSVDVDCDGSDDEHVRSIQQRHEFDMPSCNQVCDCVNLDDKGAYSIDTSCATVDSTTMLDEDICANQEGNVTTRDITGTVTCADGGCSTTITNVAELTCDDSTLITGSPASASFDVTCDGGGGGGGEPPGRVTSAHRPRAAGGTAATGTTRVACATRISILYFPAAS